MVGIVFRMRVSEVEFKFSCIYLHICFIRISPYIRIIICCLDFDISRYMSRCMSYISMYEVRLQYVLKLGQNGN